MKVAIGFFGITRSLKYTINSITENILEVFKKNDIDYDIFMHTYILNYYINIRAGESVTSVDNEEYKLLNPKYVEIDNQYKIKKKIDLLSYRTHKDPWKTNYNSVDNFILAQYSKLRLTNMIEKQNLNYDYILFMRPDCLYLNAFDINCLKLVNDTSIVIPNFHTYGPYKFNDRFCVSNMKTYKIYGSIFTNLLDESKKYPLHSETIIGKVMDSHKLTIQRILFNFSRVRCDGRVVDKF